MFVYKFRAGLSELLAIRLLQEINSAMAPKKILRNVDKKMPVLQDLNEEAELKFDMEVFWCISQLEADVNSGKLPEKKSKFADIKANSVIVYIFFIHSFRKRINKCH